MATKLHLVQLAEDFSSGVICSFSPFYTIKSKKKKKKIMGNTGDVYVSYLQGTQYLLTLSLTHPLLSCNDPKLQSKGHLEANINDPHWSRWDGLPASVTSTRRHCHCVAPFSGQTQGSPLLLLSPPSLPLEQGPQNLISTLAMITPQTSPLHPTHSYTGVHSRVSFLWLSQWQNLRGLRSMASLGE